MKRVTVISLGGSLIVPDKVDVNFLKKFKAVIDKFDRKFVIVCGGGSVARTYINALDSLKVNIYEKSLMGIGITRTNARFMIKLFKDASKTVPKSMTEVSKVLAKNKIVFCGGLRYEPDNTSDGTAAKLAYYFRSDFINLTNVKGLFDKDPKLKGAKFISKISYSDFDKMVRKIKYKPGQHFVLDQTANEVIQRHKIKTVILGKDLKQLENYLKGRKFVGTLITN